MSFTPANRIAYALGFHIARPPIPVLNYGPCNPVIKAHAELDRDFSIAMMVVMEQPLPQIEPIFMNARAVLLRMQNA